MATATKHKNGHGVYDAPLLLDWLFWLTVFAVLAVVLPVGGTGGNLIDVVLGAAFQVALFGLLPGAVRKSVRARRRAPTDRPRPW